MKLVKQFLSKMKGVMETVRDYFLPTMDFSNHFVDWLIMEQKGKFEKMQESYIRYLILNPSIELHTNILL